MAGFAVGAILAVLYVPIVYQIQKYANVPEPDIFRTGTRAEEVRNITVSYWISWTVPALITLSIGALLIPLKKWRHFALALIVAFIVIGGLFAIFFILLDVDGIPLDQTPSPN